MAGRFEEETVDNVVANTSGGGAKKVKFDAGHKYRIGFPRTKTTAEGEKVSIVKVGFFPFNETLKKSFLLTEDDALNAKCIPIMGQPKYRFVTPIIIYKTDKDGKLVSPPSYEIAPFVFADDTMKQLQDINAEWNLTEVDVFVRIKENTDVKMQNITITPTKEALWKKGKTVADIQAAAQACAETQHTAVAIDAEPATIRKWLGLDAEPSADAAWDEESTPAGASAGNGNSSVDETVEGDMDSWV